MNMRRAYASLFILAACCSANSFAQSSYYEEDPKVFTGGLILGTNFTQVDGDTYYGYYKIGLNAGGTVYVHFSKTVGVSMELLYAQKGVRGVAVLQSQYVGTYAEKYYLNLNYAEVPILFHIKANLIDFEAGLSYARLISFKEWAETDQPAYFNPSVNYFKNSDFDYVVGLTIKAYKNLYLNARYQYSILSIRDPQRIPLGFGYGNNGQFNNTCALRVMYVF
jgi:hypothetical protein